MSPITFTVHGEAQQRGSKRGFIVRRKNGKQGVAIADMNAKSGAWMQAVAYAAKQAYQSDPLGGAVRVRATFYFPRPNSHFGTGKNAGVLKTTAPRACMIRKDLDKLARAVGDALSGVVYADDSQIVQWELAKEYAAAERAEITVTLFE